MKLKKIGLLAGIALVTATALTSCTKSFCRVVDKAATLYSYEEYEDGKTYAEGTKTKSLVEAASNSGMLVPSDEFNAFIELKVEEEANYLLTNVYTAEKGYDQSLYTLTYARGVALYAGGSDRDNINSYELFYNFNKWVNEARKDVEDGGVGLDKCPDTSYISYYENSLSQLVNAKTTCISPETRVYDGVLIEGTSWGDAFHNGFIEGLLVYPVSWLVYTLSNSFAGMGGFGTLLAIFIVTLLVRGLLIALTFKPTLSQQRLTALQPELTKIANKYPNANTNAYEKQKLAQEQMAFYKKNKVNPFSMILIMVFQFPIFIAMWSAFQGSAILMSGSMFGLQFSAITREAMFNFQGPWYVAWIVFILMAVSQILSMKVPQWKQAKALKESTKLGKNPAQEQSQKTMKIASYVMLFMVIFMGLSLPIAMAIYWFLSGIIALIQTLIMQKVAEKQKAKAKFAKYTTK